MKFHKCSTEAQKAFVDRYYADFEHYLYFADTGSKNELCLRGFVNLACDFSSPSGLPPYELLLESAWNKNLTFLISYPSGLGTDPFYGSELTFSAKAWKAIFGLAYSLYNEPERTMTGQLAAGWYTFLGIAVMAMTFPSSEETPCVVTTVS